MSLRFRRRLKILPGIYLNLGRNGISTTIGPRGANLNIGKQGVYLNTGIPGTGISNRQKLYGGSNNNPAEPINTETTPPIDKSINTNSSQEIISSEGLKGLQEQLENAKKEGESLVSEITITEKQLGEFESDLSQKQNGLFAKLFTKKETIENLEKKVDEISQNRTELIKQYEASKADLNIQFDSELEDQYQKLYISFGCLTTSDTIWGITAETEVTALKSSAKTAVERSVVKFDLNTLDFIKSIYSPFHLQTANGCNLYIYPAFVLLMDKQNAITLIELKELNLQFHQQKFQEPKESIPSDSIIIDYDWAKVNKDGSRDMRLKDNYQIPVVKYGALKFSSNSGLNETYYVSNVGVTQNFATEFGRYLSLLYPSSKHAAPSSNIEPQEFSQRYYNLLMDLSEQIASLSTRLIADDILTEKLKGSIGDQSPETFISYCMIYDCCQIFKLLRKEQFDEASVEMTGAALLSSKLTPNTESLFNTARFEVIENMHATGGFREMARGLIEISGNNNPLKISLNSTRDNQVVSSKRVQSNLSLPAALKLIDHPLFDEYVSMLYRYATIIAKANNTVSKDEEEILKEIYQITHNPLPEEKNASLNISDVKKGETLDEVLNELETLIGLGGVKEEVRSLINYIKVQKEREKVGLKTSQVSYHCVFTGSPGTGKTTIARIVAKIYMHLGILKKGHLVETDRSGLVAEYTGQTAVKVSKAVNSALDGVLFIDEAYSLVGENQDDFGKEAIATLIKRMEDDRDKLIVIVAGYTDEMKTFIDTNPGFKSRFNRYIEFVDYTPSELEAIFKLMCNKLDYQLTDGAVKQLTEVLTTAFIKRDKSFGNGRFVRNTFEKTLEKQANRIASIASLTKEILTTIIEEDIPRHSV